MKGKLVIVPKDRKMPVYRKTILADTEMVEINNYCVENKMSVGLDSLLKKGYVVMSSNGNYSKLYIPDTYTRMQTIELSEFISDVSSMGNLFAKVTVVNYNNGNREDKVIEGIIPVNKINDFVSSNTSLSDDDFYRVPSNVNYTDCELVNENKK